MLYLASGLSILILIYAKIPRVDKTIKDITSDMVWMIAGVLVVTDALGESEAGNAVGNLILRTLGSNPSSLAVTLMFSTATIAMTTFPSSMTTQTALIPIVASVAPAGGWDPRGIALIMGTCNYFAPGFPSGSGEATARFAAGGYNPVKVLKFMLPFMTVAILTCAFTADIICPVY